MITVSTTAGLLAALKSAAAGMVIALAPGTYTPVISNFHGLATITSAVATRPAKFTSLMISNSSGLTLKNLELDASNAPVNIFGGDNTYPFIVSGSNQMVFANLNVHGSPTGTLATDVSGPLIRDGSNIQVINSDFHNLHNGLSHLNLNNVLVSGNHFYLIRDHGFRGGGSSSVMVQNNTCESMHQDGKLDPGHPDCIIFWTANTTMIAHDIAIVGNTYRVGTGTPVQGIFFRDTTGRLPFDRVTIANNRIEDGQYNGITVAGATNVTVTNNLVCQHAGWPSWFVMKNISGLAMRSNRSPLFIYTDVTRLSESGNVLNQGICQRGPG